MSWEVISHSFSQGFEIQAGKAHSHLSPIGKSCPNKNLDIQTPAPAFFVLFTHMLFLHFYNLFTCLTCMMHIYSFWHCFAHCNKNHFFFGTIFWYINCLPLYWQSRSVRDFDNHCTCVVGQYEVSYLVTVILQWGFALFDQLERFVLFAHVERFQLTWSFLFYLCTQTVDTYYRKNSSAYYLQSVSIPLFCISALDDPVCTKEAIPWDECRCVLVSLAPTNFIELTTNYWTL